MVSSWLIRQDPASFHLSAFALSMSSASLSWSQSDGRNSRKLCGHDGSRWKKRKGLFRHLSLWLPGPRGRPPHHGPDLSPRPMLALLPRRPTHREQLREGEHSPPLPVRAQTCLREQLPFGRKVKSRRWAVSRERGRGLE